MDHSFGHGLWDEHFQVSLNFFELLQWNMIRILQIVLEILLFLALLQLGRVYDWLHVRVGEQSSTSILRVSLLRHSPDNLHARHHGRSKFHHSSCILLPANAGSLKCSAVRGTFARITPQIISSCRHFKLAWCKDTWLTCIMTFWISRVKFLIMRMKAEQIYSINDVTSRRWLPQLRLEDLFDLFHFLGRILWLFHWLLFDIFLRNFLTTKMVMAVPSFFLVSPFRIFSLNSFGLYGILGWSLCLDLLSQSCSLLFPGEVILAQFWNILGLLLTVINLTRFLNFISSSCFRCKWAQWKSNDVLISKWLP